MPQRRACSRKLGRHEERLRLAAVRSARPQYLGNGRAALGNFYVRHATFQAVPQDWRNTNFRAIVAARHIDPSGIWENILGNSSSEQDNSGQTVDTQTFQGQAGDPTAQEFVPTQTDASSDKSTDWWSESTDGQCSESAALFAASQPAPLSIV